MNPWGEVAARTTITGTMTAVSEVSSSSFIKLDLAGYYKEFYFTHEG
jgi:hypothetical protein